MILSIHGSKSRLWSVFRRFLVDIFCIRPLENLWKTYADLEPFKNNLEVSQRFLEKNQRKTPDQKAAHKKTAFWSLFNTPLTFLAIAMLPHSMLPISSSPKYALKGH